MISFRLPWALKKRFEQHHKDNGLHMGYTLCRLMTEMLDTADAARRAKEREGATVE